MNQTANHPAAELHAIVGQRIREARTKRRWTRPELADRLSEFTGVRYSTATLRRWEVGERLTDIADLWALARTFGVGLDYWLAPFDGSTLIGDEAGFYEVERMLSRSHTEGRGAWTAAGAPDHLVTEMYGSAERSERLTELEARAARSEHGTDDVPAGSVEVEIRVVDGRTYLVPRGES